MILKAEQEPEFKVFAPELDANIDVRGLPNPVVVGTEPIPEIFINNAPIAGMPEKVVAELTTPKKKNVIDKFADYVYNLIYK